MYAPPRFSIVKPGLARHRSRGEATAVSGINSRGKRFLQEVAGVDSGLTLDAGLQEGLAARVEIAFEGGDERQGLWRQDFGELGCDRRGNGQLLED